MALTTLEVLLCSFVLLAAATDLALRRIPNRLLLAGLLCALGLQAAARGWPWAALAGAATGLLVFLPLYLLRGMAAGDVKLMAMVGAFTGPALALRICFATFIIGGLMGLAIVLHKRRWADAVANMGALLSPVLLRLLGIPLTPLALAPGASVGGMPYGVAIALGTLLWLGWLHA